MISLQTKKTGQVDSSTRRQAAAPQPDSSTTPPSDLSSFDEPTTFLENSLDYILPADDRYLQKKKTEDVFDTTIFRFFM